jgi:hypothetical protein
MNRKARIANGNATSTSNTSAGRPAPALPANAIDDPPIGEEVPITGIRWELVMTIFLRAMALVWMIKGIGFWMLVLGLGELPFASERLLRQALIVAFAVLDCAAAVGLWLLSPWGKGLWLFVAAAEIMFGLSGFVSTVGLASASGAMLAVFCFVLLAMVTRHLVR